MKFRSHLFFKELILFSATMILGLVAAYRYAALTSGSPIIQVPALSISDVVFFALLVTFFAIMARFRRLGRIVFWLFLTLIILSGSQIILGLVAPFPWDIIG